MKSRVALKLKFAFLKLKTLKFSVIILLLILFFFQYLKIINLKPNQIILDKLKIN